MKKSVIAVFCLLCLIALPISASASAFELGEYGQKNVELQGNVTPLVDGRIDEEEYEIMISAVLANDASDDAFFITGDLGLTDAEYVNFYVAADEKNVYFAVAQKDPLRVGHYDALYLQVGVKETDKYIQIYFPYNAAIEVLTESNKSVWNSYHSGYAASYEADMTYYEIALPLEKIGEVFGTDTPDKLLVSLSQRAHYHPTDGHVIVTWGFQNEELASKHGAQSFPAYGYPNVIKLPAPEDCDESVPVLPDEPMEKPESETEQGSEILTEQRGETEPGNSPDEGGKGCGAAVLTPLVLVAPISACVIRRRKK